MIVGAGPTGLAAGHRLRELGHEDWVILEGSDGVGGLARSFTDAAGFTYDVGGHVIFSHYEYFDRLLERLIGGDCRHIPRNASIWIDGRHVGYPFQSHLGDLDRRRAYECVSGLVAAQRGPRRPPTSFAAWIQAAYGAGIARHFMEPYNRKVWAVPLESMGTGWMGERVAEVDLDAVLRNVILGERPPAWGPNSTFRYPLVGGTGAIYERLAAPLRDRIVTGCRVLAVDPRARELTTSDGRRHGYNRLLSTMPLDDLVARVRTAPAELRAAAGRLVSSGTHVVGVGLDRETAVDRTWVYFPEPDVPFHRLTYLSRYSPHMTPRPGQTLLLTETSTSPHRTVPAATIVERVVAGLVRVGVLEAADRRRVVATWRCSPAKTYPVPSLGRDAALAAIEPWLAERRIWSRGRFGAWRYEIGNMDHSCMQGVEWVDHVLSGRPETVWTPAGAGGG